MNVVMSFVYSEISTDPDILAHVNVECLDDMCPKLIFYITELILGSYKYVPTAYVTIHCMPDLN